MGWLSRLVDRIDARIDRPADQSVLTHTDRDGSERMLEADDAQKASEAAASVRRRRTARMMRWRNR